jgi:hypothetical protein
MYQASCRDDSIVPGPEHGFHVPWYAFKNDARLRVGWAILFRDGRDAIVLREGEGSGKGYGLTA